MVTVKIFDEGKEVFSNESDAVFAIGLTADDDETGVALIGEASTSTVIRSISAASAQTIMGTGDDETMALAAMNLFVNCVTKAVCNILEQRLSQEGNEN